MILSMSSVQVIGCALPFWGERLAYGSCLGTVSPAALGALGMLEIWEMWILMSRLSTKDIEARYVPRVSKICCEVETEREK